MKSLALASVAAAALAGFAGVAQADDFTPKAAGHWVVDLRVTDVAPVGKYAITNSSGPTGLYAEARSDVMPTAGITYFFTDHIAVEAIVGTTQHQIKAVGPSTNVEVYKTWVLPPVISAQYHFAPKARFSPYIGTGPNIMLFYSGENKNGFRTHLPSGFGWAAQVGADYAIKGPWTLNVDVKKVWFESDAKINGGALATKAALDPMVISAGVGYRF